MTYQETRSVIGVAEFHILSGGPLLLLTLTLATMVLMDLGH